MERKRQICIYSNKLDRYGSMKDIPANYLLDSKIVPAFRPYLYTLRLPNTSSILLRLQNALRILSYNPCY